MIEKFLIKQVDSIRGMFLFQKAALLSGLHPSSITVSDGTIDFVYGGVTRSYAVERSDGKIVAFTNPDGTRTEVVRQ